MPNPSLPWLHPHWFILPSQGRNFLDWRITPPSRLSPLVRLNIKHDVQKVLPRTLVKKREVRSTSTKQATKPNGEGSQFAFLWNKEPTKQSETESRKLSGDLFNSLQNPPKRGHRTSSIPKNFFETADLVPLLNTHVRRGMIFPLLLICAGTSQNSAAIKVLSESDSLLKHPVAMRQLTVLESQANWNSDEAKELLMNETSLSLRKVIVNKHNQYNPIC